MLQRETGEHDDVDVLGRLGHTATLLWTSAHKLSGVPVAHNKELCSLVNSVLRSDTESCMSHLAMVVHGINSLCVTRRELDPTAVPFPPTCQTFRGGGFDNSLKGFWTVGKKYRVPGFLATSFDEATAEKFIGWASTPATIKCASVCAERTLNAIG